MNKREIRILVITALFTALTAICTAYISVPMPGGAGYVHFGDAVIMLAASLLPFPYALFVGAIGGAIADLIVFPVYAPFTFVVNRSFKKHYCVYSYCDYNNRGILSYRGVPLRQLGKSAFRHNAGQCCSGYRKHSYLPCFRFCS